MSSQPGQDPQPLLGQVALITGASRGIGRGIALHLADLGAAVAVTARNPVTLEPVVAEIRALGRPVAALALDVRNVPSIAAVVTAAEAALGPLDILVNNAATQRLRLAFETTEDDWDLVMDTNLRGAFFVAQAVGRGMVERGHGRIVNVASMAAFKAMPERAAYSSGKAGLVMLTKTLAVEWGPLGLTVNAIAPTFVETEMAAQTLDRPGVRERIVASIPSRRLPTVDEVAATVAWLVSPGAAIINGLTVPIDGGIGAT